jgi:hypothetical protein
MELDAGRFAGELGWLQKIVAIIVRPEKWTHALVREFYNPRKTQS